MEDLRILWASPNTLLDTTNGAALAVREILKQLARKGCKIRVLGSTIFVNPRGQSMLAELIPQLQGQAGKFINCRDGALEHRLLVTRGNRRRLMLSYEEQLWYDEYCRILDEFQPTLVLFFDNSLITLLTCDEARRRNIPAAVYLAHANNRGERWCRDVSLMLTDSQATADMYKAREGYEIVPIGKFVDPADHKVGDQTRETVLFINPIPEKGVLFAIQLALLMERARPDIRFEVVDSRGTWAQMLAKFTRQLGSERDSLDNVVVTPNTRQMRPIYARARMLLVPSVWWESGPRVIVEALLNGIPVLGSNAGGVPETVGEGGLILEFPEAHRQPPYERPFPPPLLERARDWIVRLYDDPEFHAAMIESARRAHRELYDIERNTDHLIEVLRDCVDATAGAAAR